MIHIAIVDAEDSLLRTRVRELGEGQWAAMARQWPGRTRNQIKWRWVTRQADWYDAALPPLPAPSVFVVLTPGVVLRAGRAFFGTLFRGAPFGRGMLSWGIVYQS